MWNEMREVRRVDLRKLQLQQREFFVNPLKDLGRTDDSGVVRVVLIENERVLSEYARKTGVNWNTITVNA